ncbi:MAG: hypothetical protein WBD22_05210 [Pyrinomonadaceae bacterium]
MMNMRCVTASSLFILFSSVLILGQAQPPKTEAEKEKDRKDLEKRIVSIIDSAVLEAEGLRLAQNRAIVFALAGDLFWKFDKQRAIHLFRASGNEIILANEEAEKAAQESKSPFEGIFNLGGSDVRNQAIPLIAKRDAELALSTLRQSRTPKLAEAMAKAAGPSARQGNDMLNFTPEDYRVRQEIALEQQIALLAAEQDPDQAIKLIKESLANGISWNVMPLLQKLFIKDEKKANELADVVVKKITSTDLAKKHDDLQAAIRFLQSATNPNLPKTNEKSFKFSESQLADIANKLVSTFLQQGNSMQIASSLSRVMADLEKIVPEKIPLLKAKQAEISRNMPAELRRLQEREKLWNPNTTPEEIISELPRLNEMDRAGAYTTLTNRIAQIDDDARARRLISQIPDSKARERAAEAYESAKVGRTSKAGNLDDARAMIGNLTKKESQIKRLVALAVDYHRKGTEKDLEAAVDLMHEAKMLVNEYPQDQDELNDLMEVIGGYAIVDATEAFRLVTPVIDQINDVVQASAILSKYDRRNRDFRAGELILKLRGYSGSSLLLFQFVPQIELLGKADLDRMNSLSDRLQRSDARIIIKLFVVQGVLNADKKAENQGSGENFLLTFN